jgi:uncharacterized hydrophobic protein (TIGR00341 family)
MALRLIKIILPETHGKHALDILKDQETQGFWQEGSAEGDFCISVLIDSVYSEEVMDLFEKTFSTVNGFRLVLLPVEASIPRVKISEPSDAMPGLKKADNEQGKPLRISREELYADIVDSTKLSGVFVSMIALSTVVAAIGLLKNNVAVIIGAMVIAPFLGPNVALALSTNLGDSELGLNAMKTLITGIFIALLLSACMGYFLTVDSNIPEIISRTQANLSDIILALASGSAGVLAFTTGVSTVVIGVMVAVALLPPLTVCGLLLGSGEFAKAFSAFLLFFTNIICINLSGIITFLVQGISPRSWWEADKAKKGIRTAFLLWSITLIVLVAVILLWQTDK